MVRVDRENEGSVLKTQESAGKVAKSDLVEKKEMLYGDKIENGTQQKRKMLVERVG